MPIIKRYSNRKLYNTETKRYITLEGIAELIRHEEEVHVIDHETGEDITAMTQAQIIFEQERKLKGGLPRSVLTGLIQTGSDTLHQLRRVLITPAVWNAEVNMEIERRMQALIQQGDLPEDEALRILDKLLGVSEAPAGPAAAAGRDVERAASKRQVPSRADLERLTHQVEVLSAELDQLAKSDTARSAPAKRP